MSSLSIIHYQCYDSPVRREVKPCVIVRPSSPKSTSSDKTLPSQCRPRWQTRPETRRTQPPLRMRTISPPPRSASSSDIAAHYTHQNRILNLLYRVLLKHADRAGVSPNIASDGVFAWIESTGRVHIDSPGQAFLILATRLVHLPRISLSQVDAAGEFASSSTTCWTRVSLHSGLVLSVLSGAEEMLGCSPVKVVGTRIRDWVASDFQASIDSLFDDLSRGIVKPFSSWSRPRQVTAVMADKQAEIVKEGDGTGGGGGFGSAGLGRPIVVTLFPPELASSALPAATPVYTSVPAAADGMDGGVGGGQASLPGIQPPSGPSTPGASNLPTTVICQLSIPVITPPAGMVSVTGAARTNQAYLFDPFGTSTPPSASSSTATLGSSSSVKDGNNSAVPAAPVTSVSGRGTKRPNPSLPADERPTKLRLPLATRSNRPLSTQQYLQQGAIQQLSNSAPRQQLQQQQHSGSSLDVFSNDIFSILSRNSGEDADLTWEDQIERLRAENAKMKAEIEELTARHNRKQEPMQVDGGAAGGEVPG